MSRRFIVRDGAQEDVDRAREWYDNQQVELGDQFFDDVVATFRAIEAMPLRFREVQTDVRRASLSRFQHAVYFFVDANLVAVLTVVHHRQDPKTWWARVAEELEQEPEEDEQ